MATGITGRQTWTQSREGDWAVGGAVLGLTAALLQILARKWREEGGKNGKWVDVGDYGNKRIEFEETKWERNNNVDNLKSDGIFNNAVIATIEEEYHHNQYINKKTENYPTQTGKYDLNNLNRDFHNVKSNSHNSVGRKSKLNFVKEKERNEFREPALK